MNFLPPAKSTNEIQTIDVGRHHYQQVPSPSCFINVHSCTTSRNYDNPFHNRETQSTMNLVDGTNDCNYKPPFRTMSLRRRRLCFEKTNKPQQPRKQQLVLRMTPKKNFEDDKEEDYLISIVETIENVFKSPVPGMSPPSLALGYPLTVGAIFLISPNTSFSIFLIGFFCIFSYLGRTWILDDSDDEDKWDGVDQEIEDNTLGRPKTDLLAFGGAIVSAGLLSPPMASNNNASSLLPSDTQPLNSIVAALICCSFGYLLLSSSKGFRSSDDKTNTKKEESSEAMNSAKELEQNRMEKWDENLYRSKRED